MPKEREEYFKIAVPVIKNYFCAKEVPVRVSSDNSSEGTRYMDPISKVFFRNFTITNCEPLCTNALGLQNGSWNTYEQQLGLVDKHNEMTNHRDNVNWSSTAPMEGLVNDDELALRKTTQGLRHS